MAWPATGCKENHVEAAGLFSLAGVARKPMLRGPHNARCVYRFEGFGFEQMGGAGFHLDKGDGAIAFDDEVDFPIGVL